MTGGFALEIGGEFVTVDSRTSELCNHLLGIASVSGEEIKAQWVGLFQKVLTS